jgi:hypothetical protein
MHLSVQIADRNKTFIIIFLIGAAHWYLFSQYGNILWKSFDWLGTYPWFDITKNSILTLKLPYHATAYDTEIIGNTIASGTNGSYQVRWFSGGYAFVSPQIILLSILSVAQYISFSLIFYFSLGTYGIYKWAKELNLSLAASIFLFLIWSFNGYIVSRMGIGHLLYCNAYMFVPLFFWFLYKFIKNKNMNWQRSLKNALLFSLFIFFTKLNANGQNTYQFLLVGLIVMLFYQKQLLWYLLSVFFSFILMSFYIFPTAMFSSYVGKDRIIFGGYGFKMGLGDTLLFPLDMASSIIQKGLYHVGNIFYQLWRALTVPFTAVNDGSWEISLFIGNFGLILVFLCCVALFLKHKDKIEFGNYRFFFAVGIVALLSISVVEARLVSLFETLTHVIIPKVDRLPSRLMIYPFSLVLMFAAMGFDDLFVKIPEKFRSYVKWGTLFILLIILMQHSYGWSVAQTESHYVRPLDEVRHLFKTVILDIEGDDYYKKVVNISYMVSIFAFLGIASGYVYINRKIKLSAIQNDLISS